MKNFTYTQKREQPSNWPPVSVPSVTCLPSVLSFHQSTLCHLPVTSVSFERLSVPVPDGPCHLHILHSVSLSDEDLCRRSSVTAHPAIACLRRCVGLKRRRAGRQGQAAARLRAESAAGHAAPLPCSAGGGFGSPVGTQGLGYLVFHARGLVRLPEAGERGGVCVIVGGWVRVLGSWGAAARGRPGRGVPTEVSFLAVAAPVSVEAASHATGGPRRRRLCSPVS